MSTDEAAQELHGAVHYLEQLGRKQWHGIEVASLRAVLAERDTLHARIADREALANVIDALEWNETDGDLRPWQYVIADLFVAYLTGAPNEAQDAT